MTSRETMPGTLARAIDEWRVTELDVRPDLREGREPFSRIMRAVESLPADGVLLVRAIFEPVPLYQVLGRRGFMHWTECRANDDWCVWFYRDAAEAAPKAETGGAVARTGPPDVAGTVTGATTSSAAAADPAGAAEGPDLVVLDVRGLEPPEPMVRTLEALERLPDGSALLQLVDRVPKFLLPKLTERGFAYRIVSEAPGQVRVLIRRAAGMPAAAQPGAGAPAPGTASGSAVPGATAALPTLDVRPIPPRDKHPTIFSTFDALAPGEAFVLVNDHDPRPLRYQLEATRPGAFEWEYLETGPTVWRVRIGRVRAA